MTGPQTTLDPAQMREWTPNSNYGGHAFGFKTFAEFLAGRETILPLIAEYSPYAMVSSDEPAVYVNFGAPPAIGQNEKDPTPTANFGFKLAEHCAAKGVSAEFHYRGLPNPQHATDVGLATQLVELPGRQPSGHASPPRPASHG